MSTVKPKTIQLDYVKNGQAYILVHWDIEQIEKEGEFITETLWQYEEEVIKKWVLPQHYDTLGEVEVYLSSIESEILEYAKGARVNL
jgi:hypothetical protein